MDSERYEHLFHVTRSENKKKKDTWIYPHLAPIQEELKLWKIKNLNYGNGRLVYHRKGEPVQRIRSPKEVEVVQVSGLVSRQTSKTRAPPNESISISDGLSMVVTHANPKEAPK
ncbi:MAG: hypothetical protein ACJ72R_05440 [Nitrososphaeraceae archaeon]